jgi:hypothetical protein
VSLFAATSEDDLKSGYGCVRTAKLKSILETNLKSAVQPLHLRCEYPACGERACVILRSLDVNICQAALTFTCKRKKEDARA